MISVDVFLEEVRVGFLQRGEDEDHLFTFDSEWLADPERPVLGQLFEDRRPAAIRTSGLPCWFAHLLPQRGPIRRMLANAGGVDPMDGLAILSVAGEDLPGAVRLVPSSRGTANSRSVIQPEDPAAATTENLRPRFSLAGVQWKLSVRAGERGLTMAVGEGGGRPGTWIAKFHDPEYPGLPAIEHATCEWARKSGIETAHSRLGNVNEFDGLPDGIPTGDGSVFLSERFDRRDPKRIHMEDFGQILDRPPGDPQYKAAYEDIASLLHVLAPGDARRFVEQLVFCVLCGNGDAHLKNWSVLYPDRRTPALSPAYDLVPTVLFMEGEDLALALGETRVFADLRPHSFDGIARVLERDVPETRDWVKVATERVRQSWADHCHDFGFTEDQVARINTHLAAVQF